MQGTELKKRKKINPHPKRPHFDHYRDLKKQNDWLHSNVFDAMGNYLFCCKCVHTALGVSYKRLAHQRSIKRAEYSEPLRTLTKGEVIEERLSEFVVMPVGCDLSFSTWWQSLERNEEVTVRYPYQHHGLAGKPSNSSKKDAKAAFLEFVDCNSQPNGRKAESPCATSYLLPKFRTIQIPKDGVRCYQQRLTQSLVGEFNRAQRENGGATISNYSGSEWLRKERPKHGIYPHKKDYCDTCAKIKHNIESKRMSLTRLMQSGSSLEESQAQLQSDMTELERELQVHREVAMKSHEYYRTEEEESELTRLHHKFTLLLSADYQMSKLVPYWGLPPQPGSTYYFQKLSCDIFGIVDHCEGQATIYLFDETVGPKNTDHTVSYLTNYLQKSLPPWLKRVHIFLDNAGSTNKNYYLMAWAMEIVQQGIVDFLRISFMIAGHTKFTVDQLFSQTAKAYNESDVFTTEELAQVMSAHATIIIDDGHRVLTWRENIPSKYSKLPGIQELHDFIIVKQPDAGIAAMKVRERCYEGSIHPSPLKVTSGDPHDSIIPQESENYLALNRIRELHSSKVKNLQQMYRNFIPETRRLGILDKYD